MRLPKLQDNNKEVKVFRTADVLKNWEDVEEVFRYQSLPYILDIIRSEVISCQYKNLLTEYFRIDKIQELISRKYYWLNLKKYIKFYVKEYDVNVASKAIRPKLYSDL